MKTPRRILLLCALLACAPTTPAGHRDDVREVTRLDTVYQAAVARNDSATMARILHDRFTLVMGDGRTYDRDDLLQWARTRSVIYERQEVVPGTRTVRTWGDTAVVTALLWLKGTSRGKPIERRLWFSDTYVRTAQGWRYALGQASLPLPPEEGAAP